MSGFQRDTALNIYLSSNEKISSFFFHKKSQLVIINFLLKNKDIFILFFLDTDLKGTVVSQAYPS